MAKKATKKKVSPASPKKVAKKKKAATPKKVKRPVEGWDLAGVASMRWYSVFERSGYRFA